MDKLTFAIDRIEDNIAVLEEINIKELREVNTSILPNNIKEGNIISYIDGTYILENDKEEKRKQEIRERFKKLRKNN